MRFLKSLFKKKKSTSPAEGRNDARYQREKDVVAGGDLKKKQKIASSPKSHPEILFYLTSDENVDVRRAVAENVSTPVQASEVIAKDEDVDVRLLLADRLISLLPDLADEEHSQLYAFATKALGTLACDEVARVRVALSTALKDHAFAPKDVVKQLALDVERAVAEPILKFCARLPDEDLLEIIAEHPEDWVMEAVVSRKAMKPETAEKLVDLLQEDEGVQLLNNKSIVLSHNALSGVINRSREYLSWQEPVSLRPELNYDLAQKLAGFCQEHILDTLKSRSDLDEDMALEIAEMVSRRVAFMANDHPAETLEQKVNRFAASGRMTAETITDALAWREEGFVKLSLSRISGIHHLIIEKIFASQSPKSITALSWYCGLPMRLAVELQKTIGRVPSKSLIYAKAGQDYPLSEADMVWQLEFFGVELNIADHIDKPQKSSS